MKKKLLSSLILSGILCLGVAADKGIAAVPVPKGIGVCSHAGSSAKDLDMIKSAGFTIVRTDFKWAEVERTKGQYDWTAADQLINAYTSRGLRPYLILDYNNFAYGAANELDGISNSAQIAGYTNFAKAAAARYKGKGIIWEIWNEPNLDIFWRPAPNATAYMNLVKSVVPAIKSADPDAIVVAPAVAYIANTMTFLEDCAKQGLFGLVDAVSVHPYKDAAPETGAVDALYTNLRNLITRYNPNNPNLPIIGGEFGFSVTWGSVKNETTQAQYLTRQLIYHDYKKVPISMVYDFRNDGTDPANNEHNFGVIRNDYSIKPAYTEIQKLNQNLAGMTYSGKLSSSSGDYIFEYTGASGKTAAAWTTNAAHTVNIYGQSVNLTNMPVYVKNATTPAPTVPAAPANLTVSSVAKGATSGIYYVNLSWADNSNNETGFQVQYASSATGTFQTVMSPAANATSASVNLGTSPTPGTYYYRIVAVNATGSSQPSNTVNAVIEQPAPAPTVPAAPSNLQVTSVAKGATSGIYYVNLSWADNSNNETGFQIQSSTDPTNNFQSVMTPAAGATSASVSLGTAPAPGTYYYRIVAVNATGTSQPSNTANAVIAAPASTAPAAPSNLTVVNVTKDGTTGNYLVNLSWKDNSDNESRFHIQSSVGSTDGLKTVSAPAANATTASVNLGTNPAGGTYYFRAFAVNSSGVSGYSNVVTTEIKGDAPSAPTNLTTQGTVSVIDNKPAVFLNWKDSSLNEEGFNVYYATLQSGPFTKVGTIGKDLSGAVHLLNNKGTYYYKITSFNSVGESTEASIVPVIIN